MRPERPWSARPDGLRVTVRITPKARRTAFTGVVVLADERPALAISVAAPPVEGAANAALLRFVAKALGLSGSAVRLAAGPSSRLKLLDIAGDPVALDRRLCDIVPDRSAARDTAGLA